MMSGLIDQMSKFVPQLGEGSSQGVSNPNQNGSGSFSDDKTEEPAVPVRKLFNDETPKPGDRDEEDAQHDSFQSAEDAFADVEVEETKGVSKEDHIEEQHRYDKEWPVKPHYTNYEIVSGRCPGYQPPVSKTSAGRTHKCRVMWKQDPYYGEQRTDLPHHRAPNGQSIVGLLKNMIGKDLTSFSFPVTFSEPISMTQRICELGKHFNILEEASHLDDPLERCAWVQAYLISIFGEFWQRVNKPANPLLGETFEIEGSGWRAFAEQVSHHPPVTACYFESDYARMWVNSAMKLGFTGKSIEVQLKSAVLINLINKDKGINENYRLNIPKNSANNLLWGKIMNFNHWGDLECLNMDTGDICKTKVTALNGFFIRDKDKAKIQGLVYAKDSKDPAYKISGTYMS